jgi:hypothetical protein
MVMPQRFMQIRSEGYDIELADEPTYSPRSVDNARRFGAEYLFGKETSYSSKCSITVGSKSCVLLASGGGTKVHARSGVALFSHLFVVIGDQLCCFALPSLEKKWNITADTATCFGVYALPNEQAVIVHGECEITKVAFDGTVLWRAHGKDIFTGNFAVFADRIEVADFNNEKYRVDLVSGKVALVAA